MELKPRTKLEEVRITAYGSDVKIFKDFVTRLNEGYLDPSGEAGQYFEEDVFSHILAVFFDAKPEHRKLLRVDGRKARNTRTSTKQINPEESSEMSSKKAEERIRKRSEAEVHAAKPDGLVEESVTPDAAIQ